MKRQTMQMLDPVFAAGSIHIANANIPVSPAGLACTAELWLSKDGGATKAATSGKVAFTSGATPASVSLSVTIPVGGFAYTVYLDVEYGGAMLAGFTATEQVIVPLVGTPVITW